MSTRVRSSIYHIDHFETLKIMPFHNNSRSFIDIRVKVPLFQKVIFFYCVIKYSSDMLPICILISLKLLITTVISHKIIKNQMVCDN